MKELYNTSTGSTSSVVSQNQPFALLKPHFSLGQLLGKIGTTLRVWNKRAIERRQLIQLDNCYLEDIGVSRAAALQEYQKPFWQA